MTKKPSIFLEIVIGVAAAVFLIAGFWVFYKSDFAAGVRYPVLLLQLVLPYLIVKTKSYRSFGAALLLFTVGWGLLGSVPPLHILNETIRNLYYHVPMWFAMIIILLVSTIYSVLFLSTNQLKYDVIAKEFAYTGVLLGILGILTGMLWAQYTWSKFWSGDPKQNAAAIGLLSYFAYIILRGSFTDDLQRAKVSAVYNVFAYPIFIVLIFVLPRMVKNSLHPGIGGNPAFSELDLNDNMRIVFYPAIIAWTLLSVWLTDLRIKRQNLYNKVHDLL